MRKRFSEILPIAFLAFSSSLMAQSPSLSIQIDHPSARVNPMFYGLMTQEINFSYDSGLYPELIRDRAMGPGRRPLFHWTHVAYGNSVVNLSVDEIGPSAALTRSIKMAVTAASVSAPAGLRGREYTAQGVKIQRMG